MDNECRPQIIDFGLSKAIEEESGSALQSSSSRQGAGNVRWVAPELLIQAGRARATSADVYSFGCVALFGGFPEKIIIPIRSAKFHHCDRLDNDRRLPVR